MKRSLAIAGAVLLLILLIMVWLASSVGPDTAPQDMRTIELPDVYDL